MRDVLIFFNGKEDRVVNGYAVPNVQRNLRDVRVVVLTFIDHSSNDLLLQNLWKL